jgi:hypothetical protein
MFSDLLVSFNKGYAVHGNGKVVVGGDPRRLSEMNVLFINHGYLTFYNKISGHSLNQWLPHSLNTCRRLIYDALSSDVIEEVEFLEGQVIDSRWIVHHLTLTISAFLASSMILQCQQHVQVVQLVGETTSKVIFSVHFILGIFVVMG